MGMLILLSIALTLFVGATVTLRAKDATGQRRSFVIDTEKPAEIPDTAEQWHELKVEEETGPLRKVIEALKAEVKTLREAVTGEIVRIERLSAPKNDKGEVDYDAETRAKMYLGDEKEGIEPMSAPRLALEYKEAVRKSLSTKPATTSDKPGEETKADAYAKLDEPDPVKA